MAWPTACPTRSRPRRHSWNACPRRADTLSTLERKSPMKTGSIPTAAESPTVNAANALWKAFTEANKLAGWQASPDGSCALSLGDTRVVVFCLDVPPRFAVQVQMQPMPKDAPAREQLFE